MSVPTPYNVSLIQIPQLIDASFWSIDGVFIVGVCEHCGGATKMCGPIWHGPIHDEEIVRKGIAALDPRPERGSERGRREQAVHSANTQHGDASQKKLRGLL